MPQDSTTVRLAHIRGSKMKEATVEDMALWRAASQMLFPRENRSFDASVELAKLLGIEYTRICQYQEIEYTPEIKYWLRLLASPHAKTIAKILEAKNGNLR